MLTPLVAFMCGCVVDPKGRGSRNSVSDFEHCLVGSSLRRKNGSMHKWGNGQLEVAARQVVSCRSGAHRTNTVPAGPPKRHQ